MLLNQFLLLAAVLFCIGVYGVLVRKNGMLVLMSIELILNAVNINLVAFGTLTDDVGGAVFALFTIAVAAAEVEVRREVRVGAGLGHAEGARVRELGRALLAHAVEAGRGDERVVEVGAAVPGGVPAGAASSVTEATHGVLEGLGADGAVGLAVSERRESTRREEERESLHGKGH